MYSYSFELDKISIAVRKESIFLKPSPGEISANMRVTTSCVLPRIFMPLEALRIRCSIGWVIEGSSERLVTKSRGKYTTVAFVQNFFFLPGKVVSFCQI